MEIPVKVYALVADPNTEAQVVILREERNQTLLPIWIGVAEADAIRLAMEKTPIARPLTHDLLKGLLAYLNFRVEKAVIRDIHNNTYYAALHLEPIDSSSFSADEAGAEAILENSAPNQEDDSLGAFEFDARPSDAIALSLRCGAPLYVTENVLNKKDPSDGFAAWLTRTRPADFDPPQDPSA
jgi:bifunctional DNase/RNase